MWLYVRFALSYRDVEELLAERGIQLSSESVRRWVGRFGEQFAAKLRRRERRVGRTWHLAEVLVRIGGEQKYLWRAVDEHGQVLNILVQEHRDTAAAERFSRTLLGQAGAPPEEKQWRRAVSPADPPTRAEDAGLQVGGLSPAVPLVV